MPSIICWVRGWVEIRHWPRDAACLGWGKGGNRNQGRKRFFDQPTRSRSARPETKSEWLPRHGIIAIIPWLFSHQSYSCIALACGRSYAHADLTLGFLDPATGCQSLRDLQLALGERHLLFFHGHASCHSFHCPGKWLRRAHSDT